MALMRGETIQSPTRDEPNKHAHETLRSPALEEVSEYRDPLSANIIDQEHAEIMTIVAHLGGSHIQYGRERKRAIAALQNAVVSEIYSPARVTAAIQMIPPAAAYLDLLSTSPRLMR